MIGITSEANQIGKLQADKEDSEKEIKENIIL